MSAPEKVYRGEVKQVKDLPEKQQLIVQVMETEVPKVGKVPRLLIVRSISKSWRGKGYMQLTALEPRRHFQLGAYTVPENFEVNVLSGTMATKLAKELAVFERADFQSMPNNCGYVGTDPEVFVTLDDAVLPAFEYLPSKEKPLVINRATEFGKNKAYWDGFQAEFDTIASQCLAWQCDAVQSGLKGVLEAAQKYNAKAKLSIKSVLPLTNEQLNRSAEEHIQFGCAPSKNIYGLEGNKLSGREVPIRFAGGHIHFGCGQGHNWDSVVRALDAILGVSAVSLFQEYDNPVRREFYGLPGEYRLPSHGLEYRTLSNAWLVHPLAMNMVFELARRAFTYGSHGRSVWEASEEEVIHCIRTCDLNVAHKILERNKDTLIPLLSSRLPNSPDLFYDIVVNGIHTVLKEPEDIAANWDLDGGWVGHSDGSGKNWGKAVMHLREKKKV